MIVPDNSVLVGMLYDASGTLRCIAHMDNDDFTPVMNDPTLILVAISRANYNTLPPALNLNGVPTHQDLNKACVASLLLLNPQAGAALQANIAAVDAIINPAVIVGP